MRPMISLCLMAALLAAGSLHAEDAEPGATIADTLYYGGDILTMEGMVARYAEALAVKDGRIIYVGDRKGADALKGDTTTPIDLKGHTLLPGFVDAHGHAWMTGFQKLTANLLPPPDGPGKDIPALVAQLKQWQANSGDFIAKTGWIIGFGYDDSQLAEKRHPTAADLDQVSTEVPVIIMHQSGHLGVMNHKGLELAGMTAQTPDPKGGAIRREADGRTPSGVLEEMAFFTALGQSMGNLDAKTNEDIALAGAEYYSEFGYTTAQEGRSSKGVVETFQRLAQQGRLKIDVAAYPDLQSERAFMLANGTQPTYSNHFRVAGVKLSLDGSPQGKTAWLSQPYFHPPHGQPTDYRGYPAFAENKNLQALVNLAFEHNWQLLAHTNGDAAAQQLIDDVDKAAQTYGNDDRRTVMIHAQTVRDDQLDRMKTLGIVPSFFSMHTFYWGDWHRDETLGKKRAWHISPTASALKREMWFTEHHDAPVALPSSLMVLHTTVNRTSRSGEVIGPDQRVSPYIALKAITDWSARQYFEEDNKGTLSKGKLADLVILDRNPVKVEPHTIKDLRVLQTIKEGTPVYTAAPN
ncbi:amidohydrolase [Pseudomonas sp. R5(2019)]|uniref:amidohydrolase n=1 Tax=Pseudomonas sp. R5(2019) TaxID=2697566 RepID=UPI0014136C96|nr:amidohydrolase [Pseudomonas sp. R5(2019)]NBA97134.1 amidohydrolase family protein [Pseudomonas sp. R5(2019)]